jgi:ABC-type nitrate/sulfonate/bicarbonate transport system substrate-binding protein
MSRIMAAALAALLAGMAHAAAAEKLVLQLHGPAQFEFAGYYAALWNGYYKEAGLEVEIRPGAQRGQASIDPTHELIESRAQFGTGTAELVIRAAQGQPLLLLAPILQQSGAAIYYRADSDFGSPGALAAARIGRLPASDVLDMELATALRAEGIDPDKLKTVSVASGDGAAALAERRVDAVMGSAWELPWRAREKGIALKTVNPADYRVEFYGDTLFTTRRVAQTQPEAVRKFRAASLKGWDYALQNPDEVAARMIAELPRPAGVPDAAGFARYQAEVARRLAHSPEVPLGHSNTERWSRIQASLVSAGALIRAADPSDFVYDPDAEARERNDQRAILILGGTLAGALVALAVLWAARRWKLLALFAARWRQASGDIAPSEEERLMTSGEKPAATDLNQMLTRLERAIRDRIPRRIEFRLSPLAELWGCKADPDALRPILFSLISGAVAELKREGTLIVGTRNFTMDAEFAAEIPDAAAGEYARLTVRDNGPGFSEEALAQILDPGASARPSIPAAAAQLRALGAFLRVESAEGVGTAVHIYFPRVAEPQQEAAAAESQQAAAEPEKPAAAAE